VVDNVFELINELPHFSGGNPTGALWGSVDFAISCSSFDDLGVLRVCGIGFGNPCGRDRHRAETSSRSAHNDGHNLNTMVDDGLIFNSTNTLAPYVTCNLPPRLFQYTWLQKSLSVHLYAVQLVAKMAQMVMQFTGVCKNGAQVLYSLTLFGTLLPRPAKLVFVVFPKTLVPRPCIVFYSCICSQYNLQLLVSSILCTTDPSPAPPQFLQSSLYDPPEGAVDPDAAAKLAPNLAASNLTLIHDTIVSDELTVPQMAELLDAISVPLDGFAPTCAYLAA
jgi:hypothetical protein